MITKNKTARPRIPRIPEANQWRLNQFFFTSVILFPLLSVIDPITEEFPATFIWVVLKFGTRPRIMARAFAPKAISQFAYAIYMPGDQMRIHQP